MAPVLSACMLLSDENKNIQLVYSVHIFVLQTKMVCFCNSTLVDLLVFIIRLNTPSRSFCLEPS